MWGMEMMWGPYRWCGNDGDNGDDMGMMVMMWGQRGDNVETMWGQCGDNMGTTGMWRPYVDNVETMWGQLGDNVETTWGQHGDHGNVETIFGQHGDNVRTMWRQHGDNMGTMGMWGPHGDNVETMWGQRGCGDYVGTTKSLKITKTFEWIEIIQFCLKICDPQTLLYTYRLDLICRWGVSLWNCNWNENKVQNLTKMSIFAQNC